MSYNRYFLSFSRRNHLNCGFLAFRSWQKSFTVSKSLFLRIISLRVLCCWRHVCHTLYTRVLISRLLGLKPSRRSHLPLCLLRNGIKSLMPQLNLLTWHFQTDFSICILSFYKFVLFIAFVLILTLIFGKHGLYLLAPWSLGHFPLFLKSLVW